MPLLDWIGAGILLLAVGFLLGRVGRKPTGAGGPKESDNLRLQVRERSRDLQVVRGELARKEELSIKIPVLVRRLSEKLPPEAIPSIGVRFILDFFRASRAGFFAPVEQGAFYTMIEGVGFPPHWKGSVRLPADQGMLGMAMQRNMVISRDEYHRLRDTQEPGSSPLEQIVGGADLIAPVPAASGVLGAIVIDGCPADMLGERIYISMLADLLGSALQQANFIVSAETEASADPLTGLSNRRHFTEWFEAELRQAKNYAEPLSLFIFDIDWFKEINDTHGHPAGDLILQTLAETVRGSTRSSDLVVRYGGDEFAVVMVSSTREQAVRYAENIGKRLSSLEIRIPGPADPVRITISGGIASYPVDGDTLTDLIRLADEALYAAKQEGRDRICTADASRPS
jgi:diguanylate cyclase (GGDEF)-like protein